MNKNTILIASMVVVLCLIGGAYISSDSTTDAATEVGTYIDDDSVFEYKLYDDQTATLTWFADSDSDVVIPSEITVNDKKYTVTKIADKVFYGKKMASVFIPKTITSLGGDATSQLSGQFSQCNNLKTVTFEKGSKVTVIPKHCFSGCAALTTVTLPDSLTTIKSYAFGEGQVASYVAGYRGTYYYGSFNLKELTIPAGVTTIEERALPMIVGFVPKIAEGNQNYKMIDGILYDASGKTLIKSYAPTATPSIPNTVETISNYAFQFNSYSNWDMNLQEHFVGLNKDYEFSDYPSVTKIALPDSVKTIGASAFNGASYIEEIAIGDNVASFGASCFYNCPAIKSVVVPKDAVVGSNAFSGGPSCVTILNDEVKLQSQKIPTVIVSPTATSVQITYCGTSTISYVGKEPVENQCFIPNTVKLINFNGCSFESIEIPDSVEEFGSYCFYNNQNLKSITIPASVTKIGDSAFSSCIKLTEITIPASVKTIGNYAFDGCTALKALKVDNPNLNVSNVLPSTYSFYNWADGAYTEATKDDGAYEFIEYYVKNDSDGYDMVRVCTDVYLSKLPENWDGVIHFDKNVIGIKSILYTKGDREKCTAFAVAEDSKYLKTIDGNLYSKDGKVLYATHRISGTFNLPDEVETIYQYAFRFNHTEFSVVRGENSKLTSVEQYAFTDSGLTSFNFKGIENYGNFAFSECSFTTLDLTTMKATDGVVDIPRNLFKGDMKLEKIIFDDDIYYIINQYAFDGGLEEFRLNKGRINQYAMYSDSLKTVYLGEGVDYVASYSIGGKSLESITLLCKNSANINKGLKAGAPTVDLYLSADINKTEWEPFLTGATNVNIVYLHIVNGHAVKCIPSVGASISYDNLKITVALDREYDRSDVVLYQNGVEIGKGQGTFNVTITEDTSFTLEGVEWNRYAVNIEESDIYTYVCYDECLHNEEIKFRLDIADGYDYSNMFVTINGDRLFPYHGNKFAFVITDDANIIVQGIKAEQYNITFINGSDVSFVQASYGVPLDRTGNWYLMDSNTPYDFSVPFTEDTVLYAYPVEDDNTYVKVDFLTLRGEIRAYVDGKEISSGDMIAIGKNIDFIYDGGNSYGITEWVVNGNVTKSTSKTFSLTVKGTTIVTTSATYFHDQYQYDIQSYLPIPDDEGQFDVGKVLWFGNYNDPLGGNLDDYYGSMPKGYTIVEDTMYLSLDNKIYAVDLNNVEDWQNTAPSYEFENSTGAVRYINGMIFESNNKAFLSLDLELKGFLDGDISIVDEYEGSLITYSNFIFKKETIKFEDGKFTAVTDWSCKIPNNERYGKCIIEGKWLYYLKCTTSTAGREFACIDLDKGIVTDIVNLDAYIYGHYLDDGWITTYDGYVYICSYNSGLFGETYPGADKYTPKLLRVAVEDGKFLKESIEYISLPSDSRQKSGFIVYNGRGYAFGGAGLYVVDMEKFEVIYVAPGTFTHGGIVLNTAYACEENDYTVYVYIVPYASTGHIDVYEDRQGQTEGKYLYMEDMGYRQYATTSIKASASGYMIWHNDSSILFIYGKNQMDIEFVVDGTKVYTGKAANGTAVTLPEVPVKNGYRFLGWFDGAGNEITADSVVYGDIHALARWMPVFEVTFTDGNGTVRKETYDAGSAMELPAVPAKEGYDVIGWTVDGADVTGTITINGPMAFQAVYKLHVSANDDGNLAVSVPNEGGDVIVPSDVKEGSMDISLGDNMTVSIADAKGISGKVLKTAITKVANTSDIDGNAYEFTLTADGATYNGKMLVTLPYNKASGKVPAVYYVVGDSAVPMTVVSSDDTSVTFETYHNSTYVVANVDPVKEKMDMSVIAIIAVETVAIIALLGYVIWSRKQAA